jgi:hypothetical protein
MQLFRLLGERIIKIATFFCAKPSTLLNGEWNKNRSKIKGSTK